MIFEKKETDKRCDRRPNRTPCCRGTPHWAAALESRGSRVVKSLRTTATIHLDQKTQIYNSTHDCITPVIVQWPRMNMPSLRSWNVQKYSIAKQRLPENLSGTLSSVRAISNFFASKVTGPAKYKHHYLFQHVQPSQPNSLVPH